MSETVPPFHDLDDTALYQRRRIEPVDALAAKLDRTLGHFSALGVQQIRYRFQGGGLARAVGAQQGDDAALPDRERNPLEHEDHVTVDHLDAVDLEQGLRLAHWL